LRVGWALRAYVLLVCCLSLFPIAVILLISFTGQRYTAFPPARYGLNWWQQALASSTYQTDFVYSCATATVAAVIVTAVSCLAAFSIVRHPANDTRALSAIAFIPLLIPQFVIGIALIDLLTTVQFPIAPAGVIIGGVLLGIPFATRLIMSNLTAVPRNLELASAGLGASRFYTWRRVLLPQLAPGLMAAFIFSFIVAFDELDVAIFLVVPNMTTLPVQIFQDVQESSSPLPVAGSALLLIVAVALVVVLDRVFGILKVLVPERR
jgi:putative spermidine/putrescine transport system permease protein